MSGVDTMANVLVVGGAGYVGGALTDRLAESHHAVRVYDALIYEEVFRKPVEFIRGDMRDWRTLQPQVDWADVVVWLAALVGDGACALDAELTQEINERSVQRLTEHFSGRIIFMSTCSVYGAQDGLLDEASSIDPLSLYAKTKLHAEAHLRDRNALILRLGTLFGVGDAFSRIRLDLVVNVLTVKASLYNRISVFGGNQYRPLLHVRDVADVIHDNLETTRSGIYNLHAMNIRIAELADIMEGYYEGLTVHRTEIKFQDSRNYRVSSDRARADLGFSPSRTVEAGIVELKCLI